MYNLYIHNGLTTEEENFLDKLRVKLIKKNKRHYTPTEVIQELIHEAMKKDVS